MKRQIAYIFILSAFLTPLASFALTPEELQQKISDTQAQRAALLEEQKQIQAQLDAISQQGKTLTTAVKSLDTTKKKLETDLKLTQNKISSANLSIQSLENDITNKSQEIQIHEKAISAALVQLKEYDGHSLMSDLLTYNQISDVWEDQGKLDQVNDSLRQEISDLEDAQVALGQEKNAKEKAKASLVDLSSQLGGQKKVVEVNQANKAALLAQTKSQEAQYQKLLADNIAREQKFEQDLFLFESQLQVALDPSKIPTPAKSTLNWPLAKIKVTQQFGKTTSSGRLYASGTHNGVDFGTPVGTPVMAVRQGTIAGMGNTDDYKGCYSYGRWILIQHDDGLSTIYGHLSAAVVSVGQQVTTGQVIGYSGGMPGAYGSGYSTGPHLHLGLYATQAVKIEQYTTSINCKGTAIPIAPPDGYLDPLAYLPSL